MNTYECRAISLAMARDGSSGGCIRLVIITEQGAKREFVGGHQVPVHYGETGLVPVAAGVRA